MKCCECQACYKGYFKSKPNAYVCIGVSEPFIIQDIKKECTEYNLKHDTMYTCVECGATFSTPKQYIETHELDAGPYEEWQLCPYCGSSIVKAQQCSICKQWIEDEYVLLDNGTKICENCYSIKHIRDN